MARQPVAGDDVVEAREQALVLRSRAAYASSVSTSKSVACAAAITSGLPLNVPTWRTAPETISAARSSVIPIAPPG